MRAIVSIITAIFLSTLSCMAKYTLYNFNGDLSISRNGRTIDLQKGMELSAFDMINISDGASIEIFNDQNSQIYKSKTSGSFSVTRIMIDAKGQASNHLEGINDKMRFGKSTDESSTRVYAAKGMVSHALAVYDPEGNTIQVDPQILGTHIATTLRDTTSIISSPFPATLTIGSITDGGRSFRLENSLNFPVYFNLIKIKDAKIGAIEISELGQPTGCYVVRPGQALSREQFAGLDTNAMHVLIMTHCYFDIDKVIETVGAIMSDPNHTANNADTTLPLYLRII